MKSIKLANEPECQPVQGRIRWRFNRLCWNARRIHRKCTIEVSTTQCGSCSDWYQEYSVYMWRSFQRHYGFNTRRTVKRGIGQRHRSSEPIQRRQPKHKNPCVSGGSHSPNEWAAWYIGSVRSIDYGLIPEFVGRSLVTSTRALTEDQFVRILEPKRFGETVQGIIWHAKRWIPCYGGRSTRMRQNCYYEGTGARDLEPFLKIVSLMQCLMFLATDVNAVYVDAAAVRGAGEVKIIMNQLWINFWRTRRSGERCSSGSERRCRWRRFVRTIQHVTYETTPVSFCGLGELW